MKEKFIKEIRKELVVSAKKKKEIIRDLEEAFASASEHGENEQQIIERLGLPKEFADNVHEQLGLNPDKIKRARTKLKIAGTLLFALAAACAGLFLYIRRVPADIIGQADAMTHISINGNALSFSTILLSIGGIAFVSAAALLIVYICRKRR